VLAADSCNSPSRKIAVTNRGLCESRVMWLTLIIVGVMLFVHWVGVITGHMFLACLGFFIYYVALNLRTSDRFRMSRFLEAVLPAIDVQGPGKDLVLNPGENPPSAIFAMHPHGVYSITLIAAFARGGHNLRRRFAGHMALFNLPVIREFCGLGGAFCAGEAAMKKTLDTGHQIVMCPGALREIQQDWPIKQRPGFIRIAAEREDTLLVPCWAPDEHHLYSVWLPFGQFFQDTVGLRYPWPIFNFGKWWLPFWPRDLGRPIRLLVGEPVELDKDDLPGSQSRFYAAIQKLKEDSEKNKDN